MQQKTSGLALSGAEHIQPPKRASGTFGPGLAGSVLLHGLVILLLIALTQHSQWQPPSNLRLVPVEIVDLGDGAALAGARPVPPPSQKVPRPLTKAAASPAMHATRPQGVKPATDVLSAKLQALSKLQVPTRSSMHESDDAGSASSKGARQDGHYSLQDYIRAQVERRWSLDLTKPGNRNTVVKIQIEITATGNVVKADIVEKERAALDRTYRDLAISARNAVLLSSPLVLPTGQYRPVFQLTLDLIPNDTLR